MKIRGNTMIIDDNFNNNSNFNFHKEPSVPSKKLHSNEGLITPNNNLLTNNLASFNQTDPANRQAMADKSVAMLHERYQNNLVSTDEFNKKCNNIAKNRQ